MWRQHGGGGGIVARREGVTYPTVVPGADLCLDMWRDYI